MLPLAKQCIHNLEEKRPSSWDVCNALRSLKESCECQQSKDEVSVERKLENESQLHQMQVTKIMMEMHDKIAKMKEEHSQHIESIFITTMDSIKRTTASAYQDYKGYTG